MCANLIWRDLQNYSFLHDVTRVHTNQSFLHCNEQNNIQVLITPLPADRVLECLTGPLGPLVFILKPLCQSTSSCERLTAPGPRSTGSVRLSLLCTGPEELRGWTTYSQSLKRGSAILLQACNQNPFCTPTKLHCVALTTTLMLFFIHGWVTGCVHVVKHGCASFRKTAELSHCFKRFVSLISKRQPLLCSAAVNPSLNVGITDINTTQHIRHFY